MNKHPDGVRAASKPSHARGRSVTGLRKTIFTVRHCLLAGVVLAGTGVLQGQPAPQEEAPAAKPEAFVWPSAVPDGCPFPPSETLKGVRFTERQQAYRGGDTWYPCWADDGNLYSPWTDGGLNGQVSGSSHGEQAKTGHAVMIGDDPMNLDLRNTSPPKVASALPYQGRYPGGSLVHNGIWYYGTYCLGPNPGDYKHRGVTWNWPYMGPMPGFHISTDYGKTLWLCYSANFSPGYNGEKMKLNPPGGRGTMRLQEMELITANPGTER